jgi:hypothetical protein
MLAVTLWRDEAAMEAGATHQKEEIANAEQAGIEVPTPTIYQVLAHA